MRFFLHFFAISLFSSLAWAAAPTPVPRSGISLEQLVVALKPDKNPEAMLQERSTLTAFLEKQTQKKVKVMVPLSGQVILEGLANKSIDVAFLSGMDLINAKKINAATVLLAVDFSGRNWYESFWVTLKEKPYQSVADLKNKPIAFASRTSTSGYLIPHADLVRKKLLPTGGDPENFFGKGQVFYGTGYVSAVEQVLQGKAEAAAISDYVYNTNKYLSPEQKAKLKVIAKQGPVPTHVLAVRATVSESDRETLRSVFTALNRPEHISLRDQLFNSHLSPVQSDEAHIQSLQEALRLTGKTSL